MKRDIRHSIIPNLTGRVAYLLFLIGSAVLVSFRGGSIPYLTFYFALMIPVLAIIYTIYVYCRFKIGQEVDRVVVKAKEVPYQLVLGSEDPIPFTHIILHYYTENVSMGQTQSDPISLAPYEQIRVDARMFCKYRGTYPVGVKSVAVTDFLGLFTINYPMASQVRVTARPRIIPMEQLKASLLEKDPKTSLYSMNRLQDLPDYDLRSYQPGDPRKFIHWKNSARAGELLVRKQMPEELFETVLILDLSPVLGEREERLKREDNIIETAICFVYDYSLKNIPVRVVYHDHGLTELAVEENRGFETFYHKCTDLSFTSDQTLEQVWTEYRKHSGRNNTFLLITDSLRDSLVSCAERNRQTGCEVLLIAAGELEL